ncbi:universal stress protein [Actinomycetospora cinnamomea]|uniref:Nucleotide-binding universal stress UspA family protein n=1 Tax=Actinomycetospora cinnamomea TaxID=663609 RepID=A0A2U1F2F8_9PSEU|nr:universal stress protein [Actinomycetospora cinnamomea]PVZ06319.1 nucleotide-binding universal stress UspA family protein [Actinomycetospora cinnamomea]
MTTTGDVAGDVKEDATGTATELAEAATTAAPDVDGGRRDQRVVVGLDDSVGARAALRHALAEARRRDATLEVVTAFVSPEQLAAIVGIPIAVERAEVAAAAEAAARAVVDEVLAADRVEHPGVSEPPVVVRAVAGDPGPVLTAASTGAARLVLGHRGRGLAATATLGSVGWWCLRHATCPVTVVPPAGRRRLS